MKEVYYTFNLCLTFSDSPFSRASILVPSDRIIRSVVDEEVITFDVTTRVVVVNDDDELSTVEEKLLNSSPVISSGFLPPSDVDD